MRKLHEAVADAEMTIQLDPNNPSWHIQMAFLLWTVEDPHIEDFDHACDMRRERSSLTHVNPTTAPCLAVSISRWGNVRLRWARYQKAIELEDLPHQADFRRFQLAQHLNDTKGIIEHASKCLDYSVLPVERIGVDAREARASLPSSGEIEKALSDYNRAEQVFPNVSDVYSWRGDLLAGQGRYREAVGDYNKFFRSWRQELFQWHVYKRRAKAYFHLGHYDKALADLEKSLALRAKRSKLCVLD